MKKQRQNQFEDNDLKLVDNLGLTKKVTERSEG